MSNQASEMFHATSSLYCTHKYTDDAQVVTVTVQNVQSFVPVSLFVGETVHATIQDVNSTKLKNAQFVATLFVLSQHQNLYFVDGLIGNKVF